MEEPTIIRGMEVLWRVRRQDGAASCTEYAGGYESASVRVHILRSQGVGAWIEHTLVPDPSARDLTPTRECRECGHLYDTRFPLPLRSNGRAPLGLCRPCAISDKD